LDSKIGVNNQGKFFAWADGANNGAPRL